MIVVDTSRKVSIEGRSIRECGMIASLNDSRSMRWRRTMSRWSASSTTAVCAGVLSLLAVQLLSPTVFYNSGSLLTSLSRGGLWPKIVYLRTLWINWNQPDFRPIIPIRASPLVVVLVQFLVLSCNFVRIVDAWQFNYFNVLCKGSRYGICFSMLSSRLTVVWIVQDYLCKEVGGTS